MTKSGNKRRFPYEGKVRAIYRAIQRTLRTDEQLVAQLGSGPKAGFGNLAYLLTAEQVGQKTKADIDKLVFADGKAGAVADRGGLDEVKAFIQDLAKPHWLRGRKTGQRVRANPSPVSWSRVTRQYRSDMKTLDALLKKYFGLSQKKFRDAIALVDPDLEPSQRFDDAEPVALEPKRTRGITRDQWLRARWVMRPRTRC